MRSEVTKMRKCEAYHHHHHHHWCVRLRGVEDQYYHRIITTQQTQDHHALRLRETSDCGDIKTLELSGWWWWWLVSQSVSPVVARVSLIGAGSWLAGHSRRH